MGLHEIKIVRQSLYQEWRRQTFDAFVLPLEELQLSPGEQRTYINKARYATGAIDWNSYHTVRRSFLKQADMLLNSFTDRLPEQNLNEFKSRMYIRFMEGRIHDFRVRELEENCNLPPIEVGQNDFHNTEMAAVFAHLPPQPETAAWLQIIDVSWTYDQLHMVTWFSGQLSLGSGKYSRSRPNHSAKVTYERLVNPYSLLWIAAALGVEQDIVVNACREMDGYVSWRAKCGVVRRAIPWKRIYDLALPLVEKERKTDQ